MSSFEVAGGPRAVARLESPYARDVVDVLRTLETDASSGLTSDEILVRRDQYGPNKLEVETGPGPLRVLARQFTSPLIILLIIAGAISAIAGEYVDATVIGAIVVVNGALGFVQEWRAERAIEALADMLSPTCHVVRDGAVISIDSAELVPGDMVLLETGYQIPADARVVAGASLETDESALTGESVPVSKSVEPVSIESALAERSSMVHTGTIVTAGSGRAVVVATGAHTEFGLVAELTSSINRDATPLQRQLARLGRWLGLLGIATASFVTIAGVVSGEPFTEMFLTGVSVAVAVVPEGLPAVVTITLALGVQRMANRNALLRRLQAAETLGATTVICTDKTGTLTKAEMTVSEVWLPGTGDATDQDQRHRALVETAAICGTAHVDGHGRPVGEPTETALLGLALRSDVALRDDELTERQLPFDSTRKRMAVAQRHGHQLLVHVKGAPEVVLDRCVTVAVDGGVVVLDDEARREAAAEIDRLATVGLRTLALARGYAEVDDPDEVLESELTLLGLVGIIDPPRPEVARAVEMATTAGIVVIVITGDAGPTAVNVARQVGLVVDSVCTGPEVDGLDDEELSALLDGRTLFARVAPEHKLRIVEVLRDRGEVVAMTGDGVNDAPALKRADVGVAMGQRGTDVAKAAADIVLTDDNFASIVNAVEEGRRQYANIRKFVRYLLSSNLGEIVAIGGNLVIGGPLILRPAQILWLNLLTDGPTAVALGLEEAEADTMAQQPRKRTQAIVDRAGMTWVLILGFIIGLVALAAFRLTLGSGEGADLVRAQTLAFTTIVMLEKINVFNFRSERLSLRSIGFGSNKWLLVAWTGTLSLQLAAVYAPPLQRALHTSGLHLFDWLLLALVGLPLLGGGELAKAWARKRDRDSPARRNDQLSVTPAPQ